jgi:hypothetical protein
MNLGITRPFSILPLESHLQNGLIPKLEVVPLIIGKEFLNNGEKFVHDAPMSHRFNLPYLILS